MHPCLPRTAAILAVWLGLAATTHAADPTRARPLVKTTGGELSGVTVEGIAQFRGIPFAGTTAGDSRWRPPTPAPHWQGVRDASQAGPICPQSTVRTTPLPGFTIDEDCLNLSVYSPSLAPETPAPVMVWIHGGGARYGTGSRFDGSALARQGVVVVTLNYRLDRLGLFAHPALSASQPGVPLANYGLMDVAAALRWVKANIAAFGGDPGNVTLFGQSSGAVAVTSLMVSPLSAGLYHKAIAQSGSASIDFPRYLDRPTAAFPSLEHDGEAMATALAVDPAGDVPAQLRALSWQAIVAYSDTQPANALVPVIDGRVLPDNVGRMFQQGRQHPTPFLTGTTDWEQGVISRFNVPLAAVLRGTDPAEARKAYGELDDPALTGAWFADTTFNAPARFLAGQVAAHGQPAFVYRFDHLGADKRGKQPGASHGDEVPYVFGSLDPATSDSEDRALSDVLIGYWTRFARSGDPNAPALPAWPRYSDQDQAVQLLDASITTDHDLWTQRIGYHLQRYRDALARPETGSSPAAPSRP